MEYAAFVTLALALSPVAWHHYVFMLVIAACVGVGGGVGGRPAVGAGVGAHAAARLVVPDDGWREAWSRAPERLGLLISPGTGVLLLWAALVGLRVSVAAGGPVGQLPVSRSRVRSDTLNEPTRT